MSSPAVALTMVDRCVRLSLRNVDALLTAVLLPVLLMVLFVELFGGAIRTDGAYVDYVVPGVLLLCVGYGASMTAVSVSADVTRGVVDRFRSLDVRAPALLGGHVTASLLRNTVSTVLVVVVALALGFRPSTGLGGWLLAAALLAAYALAVSWLSAAVGLLAGSPEAAGGFTFLVLFLPYPSSAFVPVETMPGWLQGFAEHQPVTLVVESLRGLLFDQPVGDTGWQALVWCAGITAASVLACSALFARRTR